MRISVFGLGDVGSVSAGCLANLGHAVVGIDVSPLKVNMINAGQSPVIEADLDSLIAEAVESVRRSADTLASIFPLSGPSPTIISRSLWAFRGDFAAIK